MLNNPPIKDSYFLMLCTTRLPDGSPHSFVALGRKEPTGKVHIEKEVGKQLDTIAPSLCCLRLYYLLRLLFHYIDANLYEESFLQQKLKSTKDNREHTLSYLAYELTQKQYQAFLNTLEQLSVSFQKGEDETIHDVDRDKKALIANHENHLFKLQQSKKRQSVLNTCRHTAIELLDMGCNRKTSSIIAPRCYLTGLPFKTSIDAQGFTRPLLILPIPPSLLNVKEAQKELLTRLYKRIERLSISIDKDDVACQKFQTLKALYETETRVDDIGLEALLRAIIAWREKNKILIDTHRGLHFWGQKTATRQLMDEIDFATCDVRPV